MRERVLVRCKPSTQSDRKLGRRRVAEVTRADISEIHHASPGQQYVRSPAHSHARLNYIARELNERPRMTLGYQSPAERFQACVASTG
jgi:hypothetical protein